MGSFKTTVRTLISAGIRSCLIAILAMGPHLAQGNDELDPLNWLQSELETEAPATLRARITALAKLKAEQFASAPRALRQTMNRKIRSYFHRDAHNQQELEYDNLKKLWLDSKKVFEAMEDDEKARNELFKNFLEELEKVVMSMKPMQIQQFAATGIASEPLGDQTVETFVVKRMLVHLTKFKAMFPAKVLELVTSSKHLKYAKWSSAFLALTTVAYLIDAEIPGTVGLFFVGTLWFAFKAGPLAAILNTMFGWIVRPTTEQIIVLEKRVFGRYEAKVNGFFDRINPKTNGDEAVNDSVNDRVRIAQLERDDTDFAGMTAEEQLNNWEIFLNLAVVVKNRFGQLLRDSHHAGRDLMMLPWADERSTADFVEMVDSKLILLRSEAENVLNPFKASYLVKDRADLKEALELRYQRFEDLASRVFMEPNLTEPELERIEGKIREAAESLREFGLSEINIRRLFEIQRQRGLAVGALVTALTMGEVKAFFSAERNRNLAEPARRMQLVLRRGFGTQNKIDQYLTLVQHMMREMGLENSGKGRLQKPSVQVYRLERCLITELRKMYQVTVNSCSKLLVRNNGWTELDNSESVVKVLGSFSNPVYRDEAKAIFTEAARESDIHQGAEKVLKVCTAR